MNSKFDSLLKELYAGNISDEEFLKRYFKDATPSENHLLHLFQQAMVNEDDLLIEEAIVLLNTGYFELELFIKFLCLLLEEPWHTKHEDIAMLMQQLKSPETVECLYAATQLKYEYLEYDDTFQFARKCIKALSAIGTDSAVDKLRLLSASKTDEIAGYAKKELRYKGLI